MSFLYPSLRVNTKSQSLSKVRNMEESTSENFTYCVESQVAPHVAWRYPIQHSGPSQSPQTLGTDVEEGAEQGHLRADQVSKCDGRIDVAAADVAYGLDEGGSCQPKAEGNVEYIVGASGPTQSRTQPKEYEEHGAIELCEYCPPERHGPELPHGCSSSEANSKKLEGCEVRRRKTSKKTKAPKKDPLDLPAITQYILQWKDTKKKGLATIKEHVQS